MTDDVSKLVTVSCPAHGQALANGLWKFFLDNHRTDSEFQNGGGRSIRAHQLVAEVFLPPENLPPLTLTRQPTVESVPGTQAENHLDFLLEFMYLGRVTVHQEQMASLHSLARELGFQMLVDAIGSIHAGNESTVEPVDSGLPETEVVAQAEATGIVPDDARSTGHSAPRGRRRLGSRHSTRKTTTTKKYGVASTADTRSPHACTHCPYESTKYGNYLNHLRSVHQVTVRGKPVLKRYKCPECDYSHVFKSALARHVKIKHDKRFRCSLCHFTTNNQTRLDAHRDRTHQPRAEDRDATKMAADGRFKLRRCPHCPYETTKVGSYHSHLRSIHKVTSRGEPVVKVNSFKCEECGHDADSKTELKVHRQSHSLPKENGFSCPLCPFVASDWNKLNIHVNRLHAAALGGGDDSAGEDVPVMTQQQPGRRRSSTDADKDEPKLYRCPHCEYETLKGGNYHNHLRSIHRVTAKGLPAVKKFKCPECDYAHVFQSAIKRHQHVKHSKEKPFNCQQCQFRSTSRGQLNAHVNRVHLGLKKQPPGPRSKHYICDVCARLFTGRDSLKAHCKKFHDADSATFKCDFCDYTSNSKRDVAVVHRNIFHSGDKPHPYSCVTCGHRSPTRYDLERHRLTHTGERPYKCDICLKAFAQRGHLNVHRRRQHPGDPAQQQQQQQQRPFACEDMQPQFACDVTLSTD